jgi:hypothetical protein
MQIGIDSFAASETIENLNGKQNAISIQKLLERIKRQMKLDLMFLELVSTTEKNF